ncbi:TRAP transporter substrate-binding protein [Sinanaerobacter chloroacetimidivorans]|uniref:TRAP transporter substrate-binding protein n=1 Tax=Sinanaerobacter chloroacetimidivorans TaxID=2818044 RepID=A0A8J8B5E7_9FIRM|nr:TRAP transporter substrate-binding protein [Sinanaerobacter chloroacetimidivorans]MBR0600265.1 TRAP transporter substrate-binding protein [Sinanaerobacter chloroacetimidivorans]
MKKILIILMCLVLCFGTMTACGGGGGDEQASADGSKPTVVRIASDETIDTPCSKATLVFKDLIEEKSGGRLTVEYFNDSAMGDEREIAESVQMGNLEMGIISACMFTTYSPDWAVTELPYVFMDRQKMYQYLDGDVGAFLKKSLMDASNIEALDFADGSFKILLNAKKPIKNVKDMKGLKIRCQENKTNMSIYKAWNGTAIPMGFSEIYTALQQGTIDGVDTSPLYQRSGKFYEVGKYYTMTNHQALIMVSVINEDFLASLPEDLQQIVRDCSREAYTVQERQIVQDAEKEAIDTMNSAGCTEYVMSDAELASFVDASKPVIEEYRPTVNPELLTMLGL